DALMYADGKLIVDIGDMCINFTGLTREKQRKTWGHYLTPRPPLRSGEGVTTHEATQGRGSSLPDNRAIAPLCRFGEGGRGGEVAATRNDILALAIGNPSDAFGERYRPFDHKFIARMPGPPFLFVDRIIRADTEPFVMKAGGTVVGEYDVPPDAW